MLFLSFDPSVLGCPALIKAKASMRARTAESAASSGDQCAATRRVSLATAFEPGR